MIRRLGGSFTAQNYKVIDRLDGLDSSYRAFSAEYSDYDEKERVDYLPEHPESFFVSAEEARDLVEDCIKCGKVTAR